MEKITIIHLNESTPFKNISNVGWTTNNNENNSNNNETLKDSELYKKRLLKQEKVRKMKDTIEKLDTQEHIEILRIFKKHKKVIIKPIHSFSGKKGKNIKEMTNTFSLKLVVTKSVLTPNIIRYGL